MNTGGHGRSYWLVPACLGGPEMSCVDLIELHRLGASSGIVNGPSLIWISRIASTSLKCRRGFAVGCELGWRTKSKIDQLPARRRAAEKATEHDRSMTIGCRRADSGE
jgi:hypothetical protein